MSDRVVYGLSFSENGWRMVDRGSCVWVTVPGADVHLQIREGQPAAIMGAFAADFNAFVEPLRDPDSACWTATNSVASSNHLSGTAMDLNWNNHPFQIADAGFDAGKLATVREMLDFYEGMIFWGNDWNSPKDAMHFQMGYNTYGSDNVGRVQDFINRKIRADGFSTFRRGGTPIGGGAPANPPGNPTPPPPPADNAASVLYDAIPIIDEARAAELAEPIRAGLAAAQCTNPKRIAEFLAQCGWESDGFATTEEYASGAAYEGRTDLGNRQPGDGVRFKGRGWIMLTGRGHYAAFGKWAAGQGLIDDPDYFVKNPAALAELKWAGIVSAWYWTVARPQINAMCDAGDLVGVTRAINGGTNGLEDPKPGVPGRRTRYNQAIALGDRLLTLINTTAPTTSGDGELTPEQDAMLRRVHQELTQPYYSRSALRRPNEGTVDTLAGMVLNDDGNDHFVASFLRAFLGHPGTLAELQALAANTDPTRADDAALANNILADTQTIWDAIHRILAMANGLQTVQAAVAPTLVDSGAAVSEVLTDGQRIGQVYDSIEAAGAIAPSKATSAAVQSLLGANTEGQPA